MKRPLLLVVISVVACKDKSSKTAETDSGPPMAAAAIAGSDHIADAAGSVSLAAVPVDNATYTWDFGDGTTGNGREVTHVFKDKGCTPVQLSVAVPGEVVGIAKANVYAPTDFDITLDPLPAAHGFIARQADDTTARVMVTGTANIPGWQSIIVDMTSGGTLVKSFSRTLCAKAAEQFTVAVDIPVGLKSYDLHVRAKLGSSEKPLGETSDLVGGDVFVVQGQSNAVATDISGVTLEGSPFIRSFGSAATDEAASVADNTWHLADANKPNDAGSIGQWEMKMAKDLLAKRGIPLAIFNGAHNGKPITWFQRNDTNHVDTTTNYGRLLRRARAAGLDSNVEAIFYFQGESDGANADGHNEGFTALRTAWADDYPSIQRVYVTQVRPGCGDPTIWLRNVQRTFATTLPKTAVMSTSAMDAHDGCHYKYQGGYELLGAAYARLVDRDIYNEPNTADVEAIDITTARFDTQTGTITITTKSDASAITAEPGIAAEFSLEGSSRKVNGVAIDKDKNIVLTLSAGEDTPLAVHFLGHQGAGPKIVNAKGIGLLAFVAPL